MSNKRSRDTGSALAKDIRTSVGDDSKEEVERRTKYIKQQLDNMNEEQLTRFEFFVRSHLPRNKVKEILSNAMGPKYIVTDEMAIVVSGLAKLFVGEITEIAVDVMKESGGEIGITTDYIEEAYRRLHNEGKISRLPDSAFLFSSSNLVLAAGSETQDLVDDPATLDALLGISDQHSESVQEEHKLTDKTESSAPSEE